MARQNFVITIKENGVGQPCSLQFELHEDIGLRTAEDILTLNLRMGTTLTDAVRLKDNLTSDIARISIGA